AAPVGAFADIAKEIAPHLKSGAIVSDTGSVKGAVFRDVAPHLPKTVHLIPADTIAGTEQSGPEAGVAELFDGRWCIGTRPADADAGAVAKMKALWESLGSKVEVMDAQHHDLVLAIT